MSPIGYIQGPVGDDEVASQYALSQIEPGSYALMIMGPAAVPYTRKLRRQRYAEREPYTLTLAEDAQEEHAGLAQTVKQILQTLEGAPSTCDWEETQALRELAEGELHVQILEFKRMSDYLQLHIYKEDVES